MTSLGTTWRYSQCTQTVMWGERGLSHYQMERFALMTEQMLVSTAEVKTVETEWRLLQPLDGG